MEQFEGKYLFDPENGSLEELKPLMEETVRGVLEEDAKKRRQIHEMLKEKERLCRDNFIACIDSEIINVLPHLNFNECGALMKLLAYISKKEDGGIINERGEYMNLHEISRNIGKPYKTVEKYMKKFTDLEIIYKIGRVDRRVVYGFNPRIHSRSSRHNHYFTKIWLTNLREKWINLPLDTLGFLYKCMPYFNTYSCCLSANPYEYDVAESLPFSISALAEILNENIKTVRKHVNLLARKSMVMVISVGKAKVVCVNPQIMYRLPVHEDMSVANDIELLFKQSAHVSDSVDEILEKKRFYRAVNRGRQYHDIDILQ